MSTDFHRTGYEIYPRLLPAELCDSLADGLDRLLEQQRNASPQRIGGVRNVLRLCPAVAEFARSKLVLNLIEAAVGASAFPVRAIFFDKTPGSNWRVPWHQDFTIAVNEMIPTPGFGPWSVKDGVTHVQPPTAVLERMLAIRLSLDDCPADNGALRVIPGSHLRGELTAVQIAELTRAERVVICEVPRGGALVMRPLLLHASSPANQPAHRRVLHVEYATEKLPDGLTWVEQ